MSGFLGAKIRSQVVPGLLVAIMAVGGLAGCGGGVATSTVRIWYATDDPVEHTWAEQMASLFNMTHKRVQARMSVYSYEDFNPKMQLALSSGTPPDLAYATPRVCGIPVYVQNKKLLNLTADAKKYGWAGLLRPGLLQDYNSPFAIYATRRYGVQPKNVPVYAVPDALAAVGMMYNLHLLNKLHLGIPSSLAQLQNDVGIARKAGYIPLGMGNADGWLGDDWYQTLANTRYGYQDLERELRVSPSFTFRRPGFLAMSRALWHWHSDFTPNFAGLDAQDGVVSFFHGKTVFELISSSEDAQILSLQRQTGIGIGIFAFPGESPSAARVMPQSGYEGWVVPKSGHNPSGAVTFINWMLKPTTRTFLLDHGVLPAEPVTPDQAPTPWQRQYLQALDTARPGVFLDAAPLSNLNATMEANVELLLATNIESPSFLPRAMETVYQSHGATHGSIPQIDCEF